MQIQSNNFLFPDGLKVMKQAPDQYRFLWHENEESTFRSFHPLAVKTNNENLLQPFFKVIRKSL